jgi:hypothetical protein
MGAATFGALELWRLIDKTKADRAESFVRNGLAGRRHLFHFRYMNPGHIRYASDEEMLCEAERQFVASIARVFGLGRWLVGQACSAPGMAEAAAFLAEARGWNQAAPTHIGRVLTAMAARGAPLTREPQGGVVFWRLTALEPAISNLRSPAPDAVQPGRRPHARYRQSVRAADNAL